MFNFFSGYPARGNPFGAVHRPLLTLVVRPYPTARGPWKAKKSLEPIQADQFCSDRTGHVVMSAQTPPYWLRRSSRSTSPFEMPAAALLKSIHQSPALGHVEEAAALDAQMGEPLRPVELLHESWSNEWFEALGKAGV